MRTIICDKYRRAQVQLKCVDYLSCAAQILCRIVLEDRPLNSGIQAAHVTGDTVDIYVTSKGYLAACKQLIASEKIFYTALQRGVLGSCRAYPGT